MSGGLPGGLTSNCYKFPTILHNADSHLNFYEVIKTEIRSLSFECQRKIQRVFAFEPVPSFQNGVSHFTIIILGVKLSNGWNREVLHIVKIWCLLCKSYCPFEYERGSEEAVQEKGVPFISQSAQQRHFGNVSDQTSKMSLVLKFYPHRVNCYKTCFIRKCL